MSGYIGGILILSGCFMYGLSYSQRLKNRIIILKDMVRMLSVMNNHIGYSLIDMTQIFERLGDFDMCSYVRNFTGYIYEALNKSDIDTFALIWNEAADKAFAGILGKRQLEIIKEAGSISTFIDKDSQLKHIQSVSAASASLLSVDTLSATTAAAFSLSLTLIILSRSPA